MRSYYIHFTTSVIVEMHLLMKLVIACFYVKFKIYREVVWFVVKSNESFLLANIDAETHLIKKIICLVGADNLSRQVLFQIYPKNVIIMQLLDKNL